MKHLYCFFFLLTGLFASHVNAQNQSNQILDLQSYYKLVARYHPMVIQNELLQKRGDLLISQARGAFDPKLTSDFQAKTFEDKNYYRIWDSNLKIPLPINGEAKAGFERNNGVYLNPERNVPDDGLYYLGLSLPLGRGLLANPRNIELKKSKFMKRELDNEAKLMLNDLFLGANYSYWFWYEAFQKNALTNRNLQLIQERFEGIRQSVLNGEAAPIDSVEALIQVQVWTNNYQKAQNDLNNSMLLMQNFLWADSLDIFQLVPQEFTIKNFADSTIFLDAALNRHPELELLNLNGKMLALDKRLNADQLKPTVDVNYNVILTAPNRIQETALFNNNYKAGFNFEFPLFLRKERAKLNLIKIKQQEVDLKLSQKRREITTKVLQQYNKLTTQQNMILQQQQMVVNYNTMLQGEISKFNNGESSIFLINNRENKLVEAQMKLITLRAEFGRILGMLDWSSGALYEQMNFN